VVVVVVGADVVVVTVTLVVVVSRDEEVVVVEGDVVDVVVDVVVEVVVVDVVAGGDGLKMLLTEGPLPGEPWTPKAVERGSPRTSSMTVTVMSATTNTAPSDHRRVRQLNRHRCALSSQVPRAVVASGLPGVAVDSVCCGRALAALSSDAPGPASDSEPATTSTVRSSGPETDAGTLDDDVRTTTWRTARWPFSMDCAMSAEPRVAITLPIATPMMVPFTPNNEAMAAASTAAPAEARTWTGLIFMAGTVRDRTRRDRGSDRAVLGLYPRAAPAGRPAVGNGTGPGSPESLRERSARSEPGGFAVRRDTDRQMRRSVIDR
jgi:hypothetical protein